MKTLRRVVGLAPGIAFVAVLSLPMAQSVFPFAPTVGLGGAVVEDPPEAPRTLQSWHDGAQQIEIEASLVKHLGLRDWMVRVDNQVRYSLFGVTKRPVIRGPGDWLFEEGYLTARTHTSVAVGEGIMANAYLVWLAQQVLAEHGVTLVLLVTPSKVETMPEHLPFPHRQVHEADHPRDIEVLQANLELGHHNHLDGQKLFTEWRTADPSLPLFPRSGTHWSVLASARIAVRLIDLLEQLSGVDLVNLEIGSVPMGEGLRNSEDDMVVIANLLAESGLRDPMPAPVVAPRAGDQGKPQGLLLVSSSFGWLLLRHLGNPKVCSPVTMYYYFRSAYDWPAGERGPKRAIDFDPAALRTEILRHRFVVVECNASQVRGLGFGFPAAVLGAFGMPKNGGKQFPADEIAKVRQAMVERRPSK